MHALAIVNREFNVTLPTKGAEISKTFDSPELMIKVKDSGHPWMAAWIGVFDHPYFAVTDASGRFEIKGLAPGKYTLAVWHEKLESVERELEIRAGESRAVEFELKDLR